jgi:hypothetical protein
MSLRTATAWVASYNAAVENLYERCRRGQSDGMHLEWNAGGLVLDSAVPRSCLAFARPGGGGTIGYVMPLKRFKLLGEIPVPMHERYRTRRLCHGYRRFDLEDLGVRWAGWRAPTVGWDGVEPLPAPIEITETD